MPRRLATLPALAAAAALSLAPSAGADTGQVVGGVVHAQFGAAVSDDGTVSSASTIPVSVTRARENGVEIVTIVPLR